jgi:hypothetical protein
MRRFLIAGALVLGLAGWTYGAQIIIDLNTATGAKHSAVYGNIPNSNLGAYTATMLGGPGISNPYDALYYFDASAVTGMTITSATFTARDDWWSGTITDRNVQVRRINTPATWVPGTGDWGGRWNRQGGVGKWYANFDNVAATGVDWKGNVTAYGSHDVTAEWSGAVADLIDNGPVNGNGGWTTFNITSLVQNWANGTWQNKGFTVYCGNLPTTATGSIHWITPSVTIDFTAPIPEPGTMLLIGTGVIGLFGVIRRRGVK